MIEGRYRLAVLADIHGILPALEAVVADMQPGSLDEIIVAGDFLGGPQPVAVFSRLMDLGCRFILGNGEVNMLKMFRGRAPEAWWTHLQFDMGRWIYEQLDTKHLRFLENLPEQRVIDPPDVEPVRIIHGAPWDVNKLVFPHKEPDVFTRALRMVNENILVFAHTHLPEILRQDGKLAVNPGSVSNNLDGDTRASYATLTWDNHRWIPTLHHVPYDLGAVIQVFKSSGFLEDNRPLARAFLESILTGENTAMDYILFARQKAREAGYENTEIIPDEVWLAAEADFPWQFMF